MDWLAANWSDILSLLNAFGLILFSRRKTTTKGE